MGLTQSVSDQIVDLIKQDRDKELKDVLETNKIPPNELIQRGRTGIVLCSLYDSMKCLKVFIDLGNDINIADTQDGNTPLIIASKFGFLSFTQALIEHKALVEVVNLSGFNAFDIAFLRGNYEICYYYYTNDILAPKKSLENYKALHEQLNYPLFNMDMFYTCLMNKIPFNQGPSFRVEPKRRKELEGKIPDPNESWSNFAHRLWKMELYQPPLVDANSVNNKNTLYMRMQTGLVEMEYDVNLNLGRKKEQKRDIEINEKQQLKRTQVKGNEEVINFPQNDQLALTENIVRSPNIHLGTDSISIEQENQEEQSDKDKDKDKDNEINLDIDKRKEVNRHHSSPMTEIIRKKVPHLFNEEMDINKEPKSEERRLDEIGD